MPFIPGKGPVSGKGIKRRLQENKNLINRKKCVDIRKKYVILYVEQIKQVKQK